MPSGPLPASTRHQLTIGVRSALLMLCQCELSEEQSPNWHSPFRALYIVVNMGMYTYSDPIATDLERNWLILTLYQLFMFLVQIVLLNMIIAIMSESLAKVHQARAPYHAPCLHALSSFHLLTSPAPFGFTTYIPPQRLGP